jgi:transcriptional regulator with XRE-family HTH domain
MPAKAPPTTPNAGAALAALGEQIRARRRSLGVNATAAALAAGMSRVTWHRIERGEPSVTMGAYVGAMAALGLEFRLDSSVGAGTAVPGEPADPVAELPAQIRLADYPQLERLAWSVRGVESLSPAEALGLYERNWRHAGPQALEPRERRLLNALRRLSAQRQKADV